MAWRSYPVEQWTNSLSAKTPHRGPQRSTEVLWPWRWMLWMLCCCFWPTRLIKRTTCQPHPLQKCGMTCVWSQTPSSVYTDVLSSCKSDGPYGCVRGRMVAKTSNFAASLTSLLPIRAPRRDVPPRLLSPKWESRPSQTLQTMFCSCQRPWWHSQFTAEQRGGASTESHKHTPVPNHCLYIYKIYINTDKKQKSMTVWPHTKPQEGASTLLGELPASHSAARNAAEWVLLQRCPLHLGPPWDWAQLQVCGASDWVIRTATRGYRPQFAFSPPCFNRMVLSQTHGEKALVLKEEITTLQSKGAI